MCWREGTSARVTERQGRYVSSDAGSRALVGGDRGRPSRRRHQLRNRIRQLNQAISEGDDAKVEQAVLQLSRSRRLLAPLAFGVGAFALLFQGLPRTRFVSPSKVAPSAGRRR
jgi:hypothetical protein